MKNKALVFFCILGVTLIASCYSDTNSKEAASDTIEAVVESDIKAFQLLESSCFSCHNPDPSFVHKIAPSFMEIKKHYVVGAKGVEQFEKDLVLFVNDPSHENSKITGAVDLYGLMPKLNFTDDQIKRMAGYIYTSDIESVNWFENQYVADVKRSKTAKEDLSPLEKGKMLVMKTKGVLGKNLLNAIKTKGTEGALSFCSEKAVVLTDSMALHLGASIRRVSDKNRNANNAANEKELSYIVKTKEVLKAGQKPMPQLVEVNGVQVAYYPIVTNGMCLKCHGAPSSDVNSATIAKIKELYPNDKAMGYKEKELRGIWVVEMEK